MNKITKTSQKLTIYTCKPSKLANIWGHIMCIYTTHNNYIMSALNLKHN